MPRKASKNGTSAAIIGFEAKLWLAADKLRNNMDAAEYKHAAVFILQGKLNLHGGRHRFSFSKVPLVKTHLLSSALLLIHLSNPHTALARLGEDEIQCEERYGFAKKEYVTTDKISPLVADVDATTRTYLYQGWRIRIGFLDGVAVREEYWKVTGPGRDASIADYEASAILDAEKGTGIWQAKGIKVTLDIPKLLQDHLKQMLSGTTWIRSDGTATANIDPAHLHLSFESLAAVQHDEEAKRSNEEKQRASVPAF